MCRIIYQLGGLSITTWGLMLAIAFICGILFVGHRAKKYNLPKTIVGDLAFILIFTGIIGGRLAFIIENFNHYADNPGEIFKIWEGGLIFYGGFVVSIISGIIFLKIKNINFADALNTFAPSIPLGLFFARIGCFLNGCCFGKPTTSVCGVVFPPDSPAGWVFDGKIAVHPAQLYESIASLGILGILMLVEKKTKKENYGYLFWLFLVLYSGWRFFIDFIRYYEEQVYIIGNLTHNQILSIVIFITALFVLLKNEISKRYT